MWSNTMAAKFAFYVALALCVFHGATAAAAATTPINTTALLQEILGPVVNLVEEFESRAVQVVSGFQNNAHTYLSNVTNVFESLKNRIQQAIATLQQKGQGLVMCFTSETQNVTALLKEGEQEAVDCGFNLTTKAKPYAENFFNTTKEVVSLAQALIPGIVNCASQANAVTTPICLISTILPKLADITKVAKDVPAEFDNLKEGYSVLVPQLQTCKDLFTATVAKVGPLVQEVETCVDSTIHSS